MRGAIGRLEVDSPTRTRELLKVKVQCQITVSNEHGLHARPAMQVVDVANQFQSELKLLRGPGNDGGEPTVADAKSVMGVITLAATPGTELTLIAEGPDAQEAALALVRLFEENFGEEGGDDGPGGEGPEGVEGAGGGSAGGASEGDGGTGGEGS